jgi:hypothetical protein
MTKNHKKTQNNQNTSNSSSNYTNSRRGAIAEIGILNYGENNNLQEFKRRLSIYALRQFKDLGHMIELEKYYEPPEIPDPDDDAFDQVNDPHGAYKAIYVEKLKMREKKIEEMAGNRTALYAVIWGQLSSESEEAVKQANNWDVIEATKDPLLLYKRILETHRTANTDCKIDARPAISTIVFASRVARLFQISRQDSTIFWRCLGHVGNKYLQMTISQLTLLESWTTPDTVY